MVQRGAADNGAVPLRHHKPVNFGFQHFPGAANQHALLFQRLNQLQNAPDIFYPRLANLFVVITADQGAGTIAGKQLFQQGAVFDITDDVGTPNAFDTGIAGGLEQGRVVTGDGIVVQALGGLTGGQLTYQATIFFEQAFVVDEDNQLLRLQRCGHLAANVLIGKVEGITGGRIAHWRQQNNMPQLQQLLDATGINTANAAGVAKINAIQHANGFGGDVVAAADPNPGVVHG